MKKPIILWIFLGLILLGGLIALIYFGLKNNWFDFIKKPDKNKSIFVIEGDGKEWEIGQNIKIFETAKKGERYVDLYYNINVDLDNDGICDINCDINGDGIPDYNIDWKGDLKPHYNIDTNKDENPDENKMNQVDGNGKCIANCDIDGDGWPEKNVDLNGDGICDVNCYNEEGVCDKFCTSGNENIQIIAPRSYGEYNFSVKNTTKKDISYKITYTEENHYNINLLYRIKRNNLYLTGWKKVSEINNNEVILNPGKADNYIIEWFWKDSDNDTAVGELDLATYSLAINVTAQGE